MATHDIDRPKKASFIKVRFLIVLMGTLCPVVCYISRQNLSMAMVAMVKDPDRPIEEQHSQNHTLNNLINRTAQSFNIGEDVASTCPSPTIIGLDGKEEIAKKIVTYGPKYDWTTSERSLLFETFFWTYVVCQIPAARFAEVVGAKWVLATATIGSSILSLITPWAASQHVYAFALIRALMGICQTALYPAGYVLYTQWLPPAERSQALPALNAGAYVGSIIASTATGFFSEQEAYGWEYAFYMPSVLCAIWSIFWILFGASEPRQHKFISHEEIEYIESRMEVKNGGSLQQKKSLSWKKLATSPHIWAMVAAFLASNWAFTIILLLLPSYLNYILMIPPFKNGLINSVIYVLFCVSSPIIGAVSTLMVETRVFGLTRLRTRKLFESVALFGQTACFIILPLIGCDTTFVLRLLYTQIVLFSFINGGEVQLPSELSLDFAGTIYAIGNCVGSSTGFIVPRIHSLIVEDVGNRAEWNVYFYVAAAVTFTGGLIFLIFGKNDLQDYSKDISESQIDIYKLSSDIPSNPKSLERPTGILNQA